MSSKNETGSFETVFGVRLGTIVTIMLALISAAIALLSIFTNGISTDVKDVARVVTHHSEEIASMKTQNISDRNEICNIEAQISTLNDRVLQLLVHAGIKPSPTVQPNYSLLKNRNSNDNH
jgi:cell division protein FtsB